MSLYKDIVNDAYKALPQPTQKKVDEYAERATKVVIISCFVYAAVVAAGLAFLLWLGSTPL